MRKLNQIKKQLKTQQQPFLLLDDFFYDFNLLLTC